MIFQFLQGRFCAKSKPGGLDSWDQSRSRLRLFFVSSLTFFKCQDFLDGRDHPFFFSVEIFKIETFQSRLGCVKIFIETVEICRDFQDLLRLFEIYRDISTLWRLFEVLQHQKSQQIEKSRSRNMIKLTNSRSRSRQTVKICQKCHVSTDFEISIETFETGRWCQDKIEISRLSRPTFFPVSRQIETPRLNKKAINSEMKTVLCIVINCINHLNYLAKFWATT